MNRILILSAKIFQISHRHIRSHHLSFLNLSRNWSSYFVPSDSQPEVKHEIVERPTKERLMTSAFWPNPGIDAKHPVKPFLLALYPFLPQLLHDWTGIIDWVMQGNMQLATPTSPSQALPSGARSAEPAAGRSSSRCAA